MVNLILGTTIRRHPCPLVTLLVGEQSSDYHQRICLTEFSPHLTIFIHLSSCPMSTYHLLSALVVRPNISILVSYDNLLQWPSLSLDRSSILFHLTPRMLIPYLCISLVTWAHLPISSIVLTFHFPIFTYAFDNINLTSGFSIILCIVCCSNQAVTSLTSASPQ